MQRACQGTPGGTYLCMCVSPCGRAGACERVSACGVSGCECECVRHASVCMCVCARVRTEDERVKRQRVGRQKGMGDKVMYLNMLVAPHYLAVVLLYKCRTQVSRTRCLSASPRTFLLRTVKGVGERGCARMVRTCACVHGDSLNPFKRTVKCSEIMQVSHTAFLCTKQKRSDLKSISAEQVKARMHTYLCAFCICKYPCVLFILVC